MLLFLKIRLILSTTSATLLEDLLHQYISEMDGRLAILRPFCLTCFRKVGYRRPIFHPPIWPAIRQSEQTNWYPGGSVWVSLMYLKWDLFGRHIKNGFIWLKMGLSGYFLYGKDM